MNLAKSVNLDATIDKLEQLGAKANLTNPVINIRTLNENRKRGIFRIVVIGEIKKGKSSFINALFGKEELLPTNEDIATSTVYKLVYGKEPKIRVFLKGRDGSITNKVIEQSQLSEYGTEYGNPDNKKGVEFIAIQSPSPILESGVVIIDTPGLGGVIKVHKEITWRYIPNADAIFFVCDSVETLLSRAETEYLQKLKKMSPYIFFVQTKTDIVPQSQWTAWMVRNKEILANTLELPENKLIYFPVSSKLKHKADRLKSEQDLDESGFSKLLSFLHNNLIPKKEEKVFNRLLISMISIALEINRKLTKQMEIASTETKNQLDDIEGRVLEAKDNYQNWRTNEYPETIKQFQNKYDDLKKKTRDCLMRDIDPSPNGFIISGFMRQLRESRATAEDLNKQAQEIMSIFIDQLTEKIQSILEEYNKNAHLICSELSSELLESGFVADSVDYTGVEVYQPDSLGLPSSLFEKSRNAFYGGMAGSLIAYTISSIIFPPASVILSILGSIAGTISSIKDFATRKREEYLNKLTGLFSDTARRMQAESIRTFDTICSQYEKRVRDVLTTSLKNRDNEYQATIKEVQAARQQTQEQRKIRVTEVQSQIKETKQIIDYLKELVL